MRLAIDTDFDKVWQIFHENKEWFPHVRKSHVRNRIDREQCIYQDEVVITFHKNAQNRMIGRDSNVRVEKDSYIIHQLINRYKGNGKTKDAIKEFFDFAGTVYLTVRAENTRANAFYQKIGMKEVGYCNWSQGNMKGKVWKYG